MFKVFFAIMQVIALKIVKLVIKKKMNIVIQKRKDEKNKNMKKNSKKWEGKLVRK